MLKFALLLALIASPLGGQQALIDEGFNHFYNLEYDQAIAVFEKAIAQNPGLPDLHNHLAQTLIFREMFRNGALESELVSGSNSFLRRPKLNPTPETEKRILDEIAKSMALADARLKQNPNDTAAMYASGIAYGLRSNYFWVVKKAWRDSLKDATAARKLHNRISELEPNNVDARLVQGLHDYIVGSLPFGFKMLGFLIGIRGDKEKGIRTVQDVAKNGKLNRVDAEIFLCALYRRENQSKLAVPLVQDLIRRYPRNYLLRMELGQMYSQAGDGVRGLQALEEVARLKEQPRARLRPRAVGEDLLPAGIDSVLVQRPGPVAGEHEEGGGGGRRCGSEYRCAGLPAHGPDLRHETAPRRGRRGVQEGHRLRSPGGGGAGIQEVPLHALPAHVATRSIRLLPAARSAWAPCRRSESSAPSGRWPWPVF